MQYNKLCTRQASRATNNMVEIAYISDINLRYTFHRSAVKIDQRKLFLAPMLQLVISSASLNLFFWNSPLEFSRASNYRDSWGKPLRVRRQQSRPAERPPWLAGKIFFWPISGTEFKHFWTWFGKNKELVRSWSKLSPKNRIVLTSSPWGLRGWVYSPEARAEVFCLKLNFNISKLVYFILSFERLYPVKCHTSTGDNNFFRFCSS